MAKTLKQLAQEVLDVQDACNLSGVVITWAVAIQELRETLRVAELPNGTDDINRHPINVIWCDKCAHLTGIQAEPESMAADAYAQCRDLRDA